jgi:hypothetical protein
VDATASGGGARKRPGSLRPDAGVERMKSWEKAIGPGQSRPVNQKKL